MDKQAVEQLIDRYLDGKCSLEEKSMVERFYMETLLNRKLPEHSTDPMLVKEAMWQSIAQQVEEVPVAVPKNRKLFYSKVAVAATLLMVLGLGIFFYTQTNVSAPLAGSQELRTALIHPGGNKAVLTLANGKQIILNEASNGILVNQDGLTIKKIKDGQLIYSINKDKLNDQLAFHTISTPKGGQYQVTLADGSAIWLNAASTIRFPAHFKGNERNVGLSGEAYFEVAKNKRMPFRVTTDRQLIEVLGTHFNINSYSDEHNAKTTLLEGSVRVIPQMNHTLHPEELRNVVLKPGEQAVVGAALEVNKVDLQEVMAWKDNKFAFNSRPLQEIMPEISRWYDVEIIYKGNISEKTFTGTISRYAKVSQVLSMLELTNLVHFKVEGRRIIVMP